jgi:hypothetical protein
MKAIRFTEIGRISPCQPNFKNSTVTQATAPTMVTPAGHTCGNTPYSPKVRDLVLEFKKGIKRDPASFTVLKDNKQWDSVHRTLKAQTCYQDFDDILNPCYVPNTAEDIALFDEKQKYMYSVLKRILQTDEGKVIVHSHDADRNAQSVYAEFLQVMTQSTEAMMDSGELLSYLTTAKISYGSWRGTTKTFVLNWIDKLRLYHELTPVADRLSENTQRTLLAARYLTRKLFLEITAKRLNSTMTWIQQQTSSKPTR